MRMARPAMRPSCTILRITPAALRALPCPTMPCEFPLGSSVAGSNPSPRMCECAPGARQLDPGPRHEVRTDSLHFREVPLCDGGGNGSLGQVSRAQRGGTLAMVRNETTIPALRRFVRCSKWPPRRAQLGTGSGTRTTCSCASRRACTST